MTDTTFATPLDAVLATDLTDDTDRLILADVLEMEFGLDGTMLRRCLPESSARFHVRWCIRRDIPEVLGIESSRPDAWDEDTYLTLLRKRNCIGLVAEQGDKVLGAMIYELHKEHFDIVRLAVHPDHRGKGVMASLAGKIVKKLNPPYHRRRATTSVASTDLASLCAFLRCGWRHCGGEPGVVKLDVVKP